MGGQTPEPVERNDPQLRELLARKNSELQSLRRELAHTQRLAELGKLALGTLHDFRNALTCVIGFNQLAADASVEEAAGCRSEIERSARRATRTALQLMTLGHDPERRVEVVDVDACLTELGTMLQRLLAPKIECVSSLRSRAVVRVDPVALGQAVINLATNARDAMPKRGTLTLTTQRVLLTPERAASMRVASGEFVEIAVGDTGRGIPTDAIDKVFEPFYTTKPQEHGTGLGLAMVRRFVETSRGSVKIDTDRGRGTMIRMLLPRVDADPATVASEPIVAPRGDERIVVIEPDAGVRHMTTRALEQLGYSVRAFANAHAALDHGTFAGDLLIAAADVVERIDARRTGAVALHIVESGASILGQQISKPFGATEVGLAARAALDARD